MTESDLPWVPAAIRAYLLADPQFAALVPGRVGTRLPKDMTLPYAQVRVSGPGPDLGGGGYKPLVQVDGWAAPAEPDAEDPERVAWRIATRAAQVLRTARNVPYESMRYSISRILDGPFAPDPDVSRGDSSPLYRAVIRAEVTIHNR